MTTRRRFITLAGAATLLPRVALAQPAMPVIGFLRNTDQASSGKLVAAFHRGLAEMDFVEGRNVTVEYRWTDGQDDRLPLLAAELAQRKVAVIVAGGGSVTALAARNAAGDIPVVFELGADPVKVGLVPNLNRPGGSVTGIALFSSDITPKRLEMLLSMVIDTAGVGLLVNRTSPAIPEEIARTQQAAHAMKKPLHVLNATTAADIDAAFAALPGLNINALMVTANPLFVAERARVVALAARHRIPTIYPFRDFADAGGLMSYGDDLADAFRHTGNYAGRVLKGEKAGNLPVVQPSKFEFVVNQKTAKALGYAIPYKLLALADEVIE